MVNPTRAEVHEQVLKYKDLFLQNMKEGQRSFLFVYYGGHGCAGFGPYQNIILNETTKAAAYPLEERLRDFSSFDRMVSVLALLDCSRVGTTPGMTCGDYEEEREEFDKLAGSFPSRSSYYVKIAACSPGLQTPL